MTGLLKRARRRATVMALAGLCLLPDLALSTAAAAIPSSRAITADEPRSGPARAIPVRTPSNSGTPNPGTRATTPRFNLAPPPVVYGFRPSAPTCSYEYNRWRTTNSRYWRERFFECRDG